jgi:regulator of RNase E activity RraA
MLGEAPADSVAVYQSRDDEAAHLGELSTTALAAQGCRGAVVDGGVRDVRHILDQGFPVFTRYRTPADAPPRWRLAEWDVPVRIGDVEVRPGDVVVGDVDGVVCVPRDIREEVLLAAEKTVETETEVREAVTEGMDPLAAYDEYGEF